MTNAVTVRGLQLGEGRPKICLPVCGGDLDELDRELDELDVLRPDLVEWRADGYRDLDRGSGLVTALDQIRARIGALPLLLTIRMAAEGGAVELRDARRGELYANALCWGGVDLVDVELAMEPAARDTVIRMAKDCGAAVIVSHHNFSRTPSEGELFNLLERARRAGADLPKLAVTPQEPGDLLALLSATLRAQKALDCPLITISMGRLGVLSRIGGGLFGSAFTFGSGLNPTAPGQIDVRTLRGFLETLHPGLT